MASIFCQPGVEGDEQDVWHVIQARFREHGYELYTPENYDGELKDAAWVIFQNMPRDLKPTSLIKWIKHVVQQALGKGTFYQRCVNAGLADRVAVALYEPPIVDEFAYDKKNHSKFRVIFTWSKDLLELGGRYQEFVFPQSDTLPVQPSLQFHDRKLICNFSANKTSSHPDELYTARIKTINFLEQHCLEDFDHYGARWTSEYKSWRGTVDNKLATMSNYRFNLCYENAKNLRGYLTEKIFDAFNAGCVPIYLGAPDIEDMIPSNTFIDRRKFTSDVELLEFLRRVDEVQWKTFIRAAKQFLNSDAYQKYTANGMFLLLKAGLKIAPSVKNSNPARGSTP
ncbi:hypothetical protein QE408_003712 [Agrobacterium larrymoorei]|uniref:Fucosyltransferase C-terminal domain-containing protein n=2 Tax=Agrobacterium larrymoorei TaxID=160699 RepID=A0ABU0UNN4_9HYPH|nr:hypothetical protein [Agrobacterium larrymoorei]